MNPLPTIAAAYALASVVTFIAYAIDKRRARLQRWRIPERTLHVLELFGGWPGALLAQLLLRHKLRKTSYMLVFLLIVCLHGAAWFAYFHLTP